MINRTIAVLLMFATVSVLAEDGTNTRLGLGVDTASGNSEVTALTADLETGYTSGANIYSFAASYGYAETDGELSRQNSRASLKYDRELSERTYTYVRAENEYDKIALVDYRLTTGPGIGVYFIKKDGLNLKADLGVSYIDQKLRDDELENNLDSVVALRLTERLEMALSETANMWQSAEYLPDTDDFDSYLLNLELGVETQVSGSASLRVVAANRRNSMPPAGVEKDDFTVKASLVLTLGKK